MRKHYLTPLAVTVLGLSLSITPSLKAGYSYSLTDLGSVRPYSINDNGQIVGGIPSSYSGWLQAGLIDPSGAGNHTGLGTLGGFASMAFSINNNGQVVGWAFPANSMLNHATLFDTTGAGNNIDLDPLGYASVAYSINNNGQIAGQGADGVRFTFVGRKRMPFM